MPIEFEDVLKANVVMVGVVLLGDQQQREKFVDLVETEVISEMLVGGSIPPQPTVGTPANAAETGLVLRLRRGSNSGGLCGVKNTT